MCGIAGFADLKGKVPEQALLAASRAIAHRGPDDSGLQIVPMNNGCGRTGLANRRLAIIDLSQAGHQPMCDEATGNWIAFNGEAFNFRDVRQELESQGVQFKSHSDTEVVLKAYAAWGGSFLEKFRGMFALAIWDHAHQRLLLARDRLGKKPLYYFAGEGFLLFASEVRALLATGLVPKEINEGAVAQFLSFGSVYDPETIVQDVRSLPAGSYLTWKDGRSEIHEYWDAAERAARPRQAGDAPASEAIALSRLTPLLDEAINLRMISDVPVGVFLSGGIDSSALVAALSRSGQKNVNTFSIVFKDAEYSEAQYSRLVARRFQTQHREIELTGDDFLASLPDALAAMDQPSVDGPNTYIVSREVRRTGLKVALSGVGGDELFAGYSTFRDVPRMEKLQGLTYWTPQGLRSAVSAMLARGGDDRARKLAALVEGNGSLVHPYFLARMLFVPKLQARLLAAGPEKLSAVKAGMSAALARSQQLDPVNRVSYLELRNYMANTLLRDADCMSMAHGLEVRAPFLDHRLVEYALSIPGGLKLDSKTPKHLLVKAMQGALPDEIVHRPKRGFTLPFEHWLRGELKSSIGKVLTNTGDGALDQVLSPAATGEVWQSFLEGKTSWSRPWALYVLERWCARNLR